MAFRTVSIARRGASQSPAAENSLFSVNGIPMIFYIAKGDPARASYCEWIHRHGGIVAETEPNEANGIVWLSSVYLGPEVQNAFKTEFVKDSIENNKQEDLAQYKWTGPNRALTTDEMQQRIESLQAGGKKEKKLPARTSNRFTEEQDQFILEAVRMTPLKRGTHQLYQQLVQDPLMAGHTGNSLRSRFRNQLAKHLKYVYQVDDEGRLVYDENGSKIRVSVDSLPGIKNKFTAKDDYTLCKRVVEYNHVKTKSSKSRASQRELAAHEENPVPYSFFGDLQRTHPHHSHQSWRDRWRKFAVIYGIRKFIDEYEEALRTNQTPTPIRNLTKRRKAAEGSELRSLVGSAYEQTRNEDLALDEEIGETKNSNIDDVMNQQNIDTITRPQLNDLPEDSPDPHPDHARLQAQDDEDVTEDESSQVEYAEYLSTESQSYAQYITKNVNYQELFTDEFFEVTYPEIISKLEQIYFSSKEESSEDLYAQFLRMGFRSKLIGHVFRATSMIRQYIVKYFRVIATRLKDDPKLLDNTTALLEPRGEAGIWDHGSDILIYRTWPNYGSNLVKPLVKIHGRKNVDERNEFLSSLFLGQDSEPQDWDI